MLERELHAIAPPLLLPQVIGLTPVQVIEPITQGRYDAAADDYFQY